MLQNASVIHISQIINLLYRLCIIKSYTFQFYTEIRKQKQSSEHFHVSYYRTSNRSVNSKYNFECLNTYPFNSHPHLWYQFAVKDDKFWIVFPVSGLIRLPFLWVWLRFQSCWITPYSVETDIASVCIV